MRGDAASCRPVAAIRAGDDLRSACRVGLLLTNAADLMDVGPLETGIEVAWRR